ncbi:cation:proton antiporter [Nocardioides carbamazepini]|uniref:cation:proton antiporter domain-containing protein n=1 Tax=Nocardioides carbamazepini TaxID=2854259 RepID=UPI002149A374|nr:cation:proton antiporter [Nocardioides carbamazepini]MCR1783626.1 cation:proton antiporter [Nocardioides carbamazepini]
MEIALLLVAIAVVVLTVTALSERVEIPAPLTLVVVGVAASYVPGVPQLHLEPEVVLLGLLPPLLYSAAVNTSLVDFNANRGPILLLSVGLVAFTTVGVAVVVKLVIPDLGWALAVAIGAVVAPPDAVAATAIGRRIGLPRRVVTILEGESLLNDASALVALRTAIAALGATVAAWEVGLDFAVAAGGGAAVGGLTFVVVGFIRKKVTDPLLDTAISLVIPFASYILAEEVHASGVVAVVVAGLLLGHVAPVLQSAQSRIAERTNWRTIAYVLENTVFLLIGLQADWLLGEVGESEFAGSRIAVACAAAFGACVVLRLVWVFAASGLLLRRSDAARGEEPMLWRSSFLIGWAGMRGVVTLAAAFTVPEDTAHREVLLVIAFTVVAGTLLGQGMTLPLLARRLRVAGPDPHDDALARATLLQQAAKAGIHRLDELAADADDPHQVRALIIQRIEQRNFAAWERLGTTEGEESPSDLYSRWRGDMIEAERRRVLEIRSTGSVPSEIVSEVLAMLDVEESMLDAAEAARADLRSTGRQQRHDGCEHLASTPLLDPPDEPACAACLADGTRWVALRMCLSCGEVGCCDSSPGRHATAHFRTTQHAVMRSVEPDEDWRWCFVHHQTG